MSLILDRLNHGEGSIVIWFLTIIRSKYHYDCSSKYSLESINENCEGKGIEAFCKD